MLITHEVKNFIEQEFGCKCKDSDCNMKFGTMDSVLMIALDIIRKYHNEPITVNSGRRCVAHNKAVGGAVNSKHTLRKAVDISSADYADLKMCVVDVVDTMFFPLRVIFYDKEKFIHIERS